ncbi:hypothetical protein L227DRAFT_599683 [Lentinus tigrinus ALCF2SS1-6]|uniref:Uncharacterized protein n=1 Tax=Lentinus tigrinus ALCF2SS1-6 TaxID=1328759 RepID=A0A5C2SLE9_9APHY|nr:hypothetical protein L227DRAFT_599683 [Lentinus tigrinus ALCF2SS1-6]
MSTSATSFTLRPGGQVISEASYDPAFYHNIVSQLPQSLGVLVIGLILISISFWIVCSKAVEYTCRAKVDERGTEATVTCLIMLSLAQFIIAVYKVYRSVVTNSGDLFRLLDDNWLVILTFIHVIIRAYQGPGGRSVPIQILMMALTACVAQGWLSPSAGSSRTGCISESKLRNHEVTQNQLINKSTIALIVTQLVSVAEMFQRGYGAVMIFNHGYFSTYAMFGLSASIDVALASVLYLVQRSTRKNATVREMLQYWTFGSLVGSGILSIFAAIMLAVAGLNLVWLVTSFVLGNLMSASLLATPRSSVRVQHTRQFRRPPARSGMSTPTLINDVEGRVGDAIEIQALEAPAPATTTLPVKAWIVFYAALLR